MDLVGHGSNQEERFRRYQSQPVGRVVQLINPILRGWVTYFAIGDSSRCFGYVQDWVERKARRHLMRARKRQGFGWKRWSRRWLYDTLDLFRPYLRGGVASNGISLPDQVDGLVDASQFHDRACQAGGVRFSEKSAPVPRPCTVPSFREPETRSMSSRWRQMRAALA